THLHLERHLVLAQPSRDLRIVHPAGLAPGEGCHGLDHIALLATADARGVAHVENGVAFGAELHPLEAAGEKTAVPLASGDGLHLSATALRHEHDIPRKVRRLGSNAIPDPGT